MTTPFENFVNIALGKSVSADVTLPTADDIPVFTGIGRQVTGKTIAELGLATSSQLTDKADLVDGLVPANQLPGYVDDVLEYADLASFPLHGEASKLYIAIDTNLVYRWGGSTYVVTSSSLALGELLLPPTMEIRVKQLMTIAKIQATHIIYLQQVLVQTAILQAQIGIRLTVN